MIYPYLSDNPEILQDTSIEWAAVNAAQEEPQILSMLEKEDFADPEIWHIFSNMVIDKPNGVINVMLSNESISTKCKHWMRQYGWLTKINEAAYMGPIEQMVPNLKLLRLRREAKKFASTAKDGAIPQEFAAKAAELARMMPKEKSVQDIAKMIGIKKESISTGYSMLDSIPLGSVVIIASETAVGKTTLAINIAARMLKADLSVHYISLEMQSATIATRLLQCGIGLSQKEAEASGDRLLEYDGRLEIDDHKTKYPDIISSLIANPMADVHIIDHLHIINYGEKVHSQLQALESMTRGFKEYAQQNDKVVILLSQLNREGAKRGTPPVLSDLRGSGSIEQDADIVTMLHWPYRQEDTKVGFSSISSVNKIASDLEGSVEERTWYVRKNRYGSTGSCKLTLDPESMTFRKIEV